MKIVKFAENVIKAIISELVIHSNRVQYSHAFKQGAWYLMVKIDRTDFGKVNGVGGKKYEALRVIVELMGAKYGVPMMLKIEDTGVGTPEQFAEKPERRITWDKTKIMNLAKSMLNGILAHPYAVEFKDDLKGNTFIHIQMDGSENPAIIEGIEEMLQPLFDSFGARQGRRLFLKVKVASQANAIAA